MKDSLKNQILNYINSSKQKGTAITKILANFKHKSEKYLLQQIGSLLKCGSVFEHNKKLFSAKLFNLVPAIIIKNCKKFCFAKNLDNNTEYCIPISLSKQSLINDVVLLKLLPKKITKRNPKHFTNFVKEAQVVHICEQKSFNFIGTVTSINNNYYVKPDDNFCGLLLIKNITKKIKINDKVYAKINRKVFDLENPECTVIKTYGNSNKAYICAKACVENSNVPIKFSKKILKETSKFNLKQNCELIERLDLTKELIFTIDSEKAKDLDDAISACETDFGYSVGVHIADVSNFVKFKSETDNEALKRGNSIYIANKVIPMLPVKLSNDLCSLQPNEIKLTFSVLINLDFDGNVLNFKIVKTKIKSKIKGIYEEINQILTKNYENESISKKLKIKYDTVLKSLKLMLKLCKKLKNKRISRGSLQLQSTECEIELDEQNKTKNVQRKEQNLSEQIVEEFMLLANECVAEFATNNNLSIFYRTHDKPPKEKIENLKELLNRIGLNTNKIKPNLKAKVLANLLEQTKNSSVFTVVNSNILKCMAKAKYSIKCEKHYGLALKLYTHFTSPIRRYCDLTVHRILTEFLYKKSSSKKINKKYGNFLSKATKTINKTERSAIKLERTCENYFKTEFMVDKIGQKFNAIITHCNQNGMFVQISNTIEGFVRIETLKEKFKFDGFFKLISLNKKTQFKVGQKIKVQCVAANVSSKSIDFIICQ